VPVQWAQGLGETRVPTNKSRRLESAAPGVGVLGRAVTTGKRSGHNAINGLTRNGPLAAERITEGAASPPRERCSARSRSRTPPDMAEEGC
jgi:hypothetical protein